jgi:tetratricopeptide (TPR) repeat protein
LLNTLGWCFAEIGSFTKAREFNERAAAIAHEIGDPEIISNSEINLAGNHLALGETERALTYIVPIRDALARPGDPWMRWRYALHAFDTLGRVALTRREPERTLEYAETQLAGARRHRVPKVEARALVLRAEALLAVDRRDDADAALADAVRIADAIGHPRVAWQALALRAEVARRSGRRDDAKRHSARHRELIAAATRSLADASLRADLEAAAAAQLA